MSLTLLLFAPLSRHLSPPRPPHPSLTVSVYSVSHPSAVRPTLQTLVPTQASTSFSHGLCVFCLSPFCCSPHSPDTCPHPGLHILLSRSLCILSLILLLFVPLSRHSSPPRPPHPSLTVSVYSVSQSPAVRPTLQTLVPSQASTPFSHGLCVFCLSISCRSSHSPDTCPLPGLHTLLSRSLCILSLNLLPFVPLSRHLSPPRPPYPSLTVSVYSVSHSSAVRPTLQTLVPSQASTPFSHGLCVFCLSISCRSSHSPDTCPHPGLHTLLSRSLCILSLTLLLFVPLSRHLSPPRPPHASLTVSVYSVSHPSAVRPTLQTLVPTQASTPFSHGLCVFCLSSFCCSSHSPDTCPHPGLHTLLSRSLCILSLTLLLSVPLSRHLSPPRPPHPSLTVSVYSVSHPSAVRPTLQTLVPTQASTPFSHGLCVFCLSSFCCSSHSPDTCPHPGLHTLLSRSLCILSLTLLLFIPLSRHLSPPRPPHPSLMVSVYSVSQSPAVHPTLQTLFPPPRPPYPSLTVSVYSVSHSSAVRPTLQTLVPPPRPPHPSLTVSVYSVSHPSAVRPTLQTLVPSQASTPFSHGLCVFCLSPFCRSSHSPDTCPLPGLHTLLSRSLCILSLTLLLFAPLSKHLSPPRPPHPSLTVSVYSVSHPSAVRPTLQTLVPTQASTPFSHGLCVFCLSPFCCRSRSPDTCPLPGLHTLLSRSLCILSLTLLLFAPLSRHLSPPRPPHPSLTVSVYSVSHPSAVRPTLQTLVPTQASTPFSHGLCVFCLSLFCCSSHSPDTCPHPGLHTLLSWSLCILSLNLLLFIPLSRHFSPHPGLHTLLSRSLCILSLTLLLFVPLSRHLSPHPGLHTLLSRSLCILSLTLLPFVPLSRHLSPPRPPHPSLTVSVYSVSHPSAVRPTLQTLVPSQASTPFSHGLCVFCLSISCRSSHSPDTCPLPGLHTLLSRSLCILSLNLLPFVPLSRHLSPPRPPHPSLTVSVYSVSHPSAVRPTLPRHLSPPRPPHPSLTVSVYSVSQSPAVRPALQTLVPTQASTPFSHGLCVFCLSISCRSSHSPDTCPHPGLHTLLSRSLCILSLTLLPFVPLSRHLSPPRPPHPSLAVSVYSVSHPSAVHPTLQTLVPTQASTPFSRGLCVFCLSPFCCSSHSPDTCPHPGLHTLLSRSLCILSLTLLLFAPLSRHLSPPRPPHPSLTVSVYSVSHPSAVRPTLQTLVPTQASTPFSHGLCVFCLSPFCCRSRSPDTCPLPGLHTLLSRSLCILSLTLLLFAPLSRHLSPPRPPHPSLTVSVYSVSHPSAVRPTLQTLVPTQASTPFSHGLCVFCLSLFCCSSHSPDTCPHPGLHTLLSWSLCILSLNLLLFIPLSRHFSPHPGLHTLLSRSLCILSLTLLLFVPLSRHLSPHPGLHTLLSRSLCILSLTLLPFVPLSRHLSPPRPPHRSLTVSVYSVSHPSAVRPTLQTLVPSQASTPFSHGLCVFCLSISCRSSHSPDTCPLPGLHTLLSRSLCILSLNLLPFVPLSRHLSPPRPPHPSLTVSVYSVSHPSAVRPTLQTLVPTQASTSFSHGLCVFCLSISCCSSRSPDTCPHPGLHTLLSRSLCILSLTLLLFVPLSRHLSPPRPPHPSLTVSVYSVSQSPAVRPTLQTLVPTQASIPFSHGLCVFCLSLFCRSSHSPDTCPHPGLHTLLSRSLCILSLTPLLFIPLSRHLSPPRPPHPSLAVSVYSVSHLSAVRPTLQTLVPTQASTPFPHGLCVFCLSPFCCSSRSPDTCPLPGLHTLLSRSLCILSLNLLLLVPLSRHLSPPKPPHPSLTVSVYSISHPSAVHPTLQTLVPTQASIPFSHGLCVFCLSPFCCSSRSPDTCPHPGLHTLLSRSLCILSLTLLLFIPLSRHLSPPRLPHPSLTVSVYSVSLALLPFVPLSRHLSPPRPPHPSLTVSMYSVSHPSAVRPTLQTLVPTQASTPFSHGLCVFRFFLSSRFFLKPK